MRGSFALVIAALMLLAAAPAAAEIPAGNLIQNPGAEAAPGATDDIQVVPLPSWTVQSSFTSIAYGTPTFLPVEDSEVWGGGANFFVGGPDNAASEATQIVSVSAAREEIDDGDVTITLAALIGGWQEQEDAATVTATALNGTGTSLGSVELPAVTAADRSAGSTLIARSATAPVPRGTRRFSIRLAAVRAAGDYNDGYIDNVSLMLAEAGTTPTTPTTPGAQDPVPVFHRTVVVRRVSGTVRVRRPESRRFVELDETTEIPLGSTVDTKRGVVELTSVPRAGGTPETARFFDGIFVVRQPGRITELTLSEALRRCPRRASSAQTKPRSRKLWGDGRGAFRTVGRYSAATVRGTRWLVQDTCAGTLTRVREGSVTVRDRVRQRTVVVRAGRRYLARPR